MDPTYLFLIAHADIINAAARLLTALAHLVWAWRSRS
jgi:hypothetical protein